MSLCPCGSNVEADSCCLPIIEGKVLAKSPEALMRARYTAHATKQYDFLSDSSHPEFREDASAEQVEEWSSLMEWKSLEIISTKDGGDSDETGEVSFCAHYTVRDYPQELREDAFFRKEGDQWFYVEGTVHGKEPVRREGPKLGRNDPCSCGSGKKFKKCCMGNEA